MENVSPLAIPDSVEQANRAFLAAREAMEPAIRAGEDGLAIANALEELTDAWLLFLFSEALPASLRPRLSLHAIGGYGRGELAIHSDLDVLIALHDEEIATEPELEAAVERWMVWARQTRMRLSHVVRTPSQALESRADFPSAVALLDRRLLRADDVLPPAFDRPELLVFLRGDDQGRSFVARLLEGHRHRVARQGETVFLLEPDVKHGEGGLRDLNDLAWAARVRADLDVRRLRREPGVEAAGLHEDHARLYRRSLSSILALRNRLHLLRGRKHDRYTFREQQQVATMELALLGGEPPFEANELQAEIELQMAAYYRQARAVDQLAERFLRRWAAPDSPPRRLAITFEARASRLCRTRDVPIDPFAALRLADEEDLLLDPDLETYMEEDVATWPSGDDCPPERALALRELLVDRDLSWRTSRRLLELGILTRIVPEFAPLLCHVQHDLYHVYTTDIHSLKCLEAGRDLLRADPTALRWPFFGHEARSIEDTEVFLLACLFHDIGKNRGGNHSERGADLVVDLGPRLGLTEAQVSRLRFLVLHHLDLSLTSRRRDISDPAVIDELAIRIGTLECLHQLSALTYCDMATVGPDVMNDWNASLLIELTGQIGRRIHEGPFISDAAEQAVREDALQSVLRWRPELDPEALGAFLDELPSEHLQESPTPEVAALEWIRQFETFQQALQDPRRIAVTHEVLPDRGVTELVVCAPDRPGTLARIAGAIASTGLNIMAADILTTTSGQTLDRFRVAHFNPRAVPPVGHQPVTDERRLQRLTRRVIDVLADELDVDDLLARRIGEQRLAPRTMPTVGTEVRRVENPADDDTTILEVRAPDRLGLLYTIANTLMQAGVTTLVSRVDSLGAKAIDTFYVREADGTALSEERVDALVLRLLTVLEDDPGLSGDDKVR